MSTQVADALPYAIKALFNRDLNKNEIAQIKKYYDEATGTSADRAATAIAKFTGISRDILRQMVKNCEGNAGISASTLQWLV